VEQNIIKFSFGVSMGRLRRLYWRPRKAVSELMAIVIILAIVLAVGGFIFAWTFGLIRTGAAQAEVQVEYARLLYTTGSGWLFTISVKNTGTVSTSDVRFYIIGLRGDTRIAWTIPPGGTSGGTWGTSSAAIGKTYTVILMVWFKDGSYKEYQVNVVAEQG